MGIDVVVTPFAVFLPLEVPGPELLARGSGDDSEHEEIENGEQGGEDREPAAEGPETEEEEGMLAEAGLEERGAGKHHDHGREHRVKHEDAPRPLRADDAFGDEDDELQHGRNDGG